MGKLNSLVASVLNIHESQVVPELSPQNTPSWDSLNSIMLIAEIEKAFSIKFDMSEAMLVKNFADLENLLKAKGVTL